MSGNGHWGKISIVIVIMVSFIMSIVLSTSSFTGYIITEEVNSGLNELSLGFFAVGLFCTFVYLRKFKVKRG